MSPYVEAGGFNPLEPYGVDNYPPEREQLSFMRAALEEADQLPDPARYLKGPFATDFEHILRETDIALRALNPTYTPEHLMPWAYRAEPVRSYVDRLARDNANAYRALTAVGTNRNRQIWELSTAKIGPALADQIIEPGTLDTPPYHYQGEHWKDQRNARACANACFRMVFDGIAGWSPREDIVADEVTKKHGSHIIEDVDYRKLFATEIFQETVGKHVQSFEIMGSSLKAIGGIALGVKRRNPEAKVFSVISIRSQNASVNTWHQNLLLAAEPHSISVHNPSASAGPERVISRKDFYAYWATAHNRAQIFIST